MSPTNPLPTGTELYDAIMTQIEPELTSDNLPKLKEKYDAASLQEKQKMNLRFLRAFVEYDKAFDALVQAPVDILHEYEDTLLEMIEQSNGFDLTS